MRFCLESALHGIAVAAASLRFRRNRVAGQLPRPLADDITPWPSACDRPYLCNPTNDVSVVDLFVYAANAAIPDQRVKSEELMCLIALGVSIDRIDCLERVAR